MKTQKKVRICIVIFLILITGFVLFIQYIRYCDRQLVFFMDNELSVFEDGHPLEGVKYEWLSKQYQGHITKEGFEGIETLAEAAQLLNVIEPKFTLSNIIIHEDRDRYKKPFEGIYEKNGKKYWHHHSVKIGMEELKPVIIEWKIYIKEVEN